MNLMDLKSFLDDVIDSFAAVLDLELTVINADPMLRVSGTGAFRGLNRTRWEQTYTSLVIESGEPMVALEPTEYDLALSHDYPQYSIILYPIVHNRLVEGVIVLASFTLEQKKIIAERTSELLSYMEKTASLILAKLEQQRLLAVVTTSNAQLSEVFESVKDGLLLYTQDQGILQINERGKKLLRMGDNSEQAQQMRNELVEIAAVALEKRQIVEQQFDYRTDLWTIALFVEARPVHRNSGSVICVIRPFRDVQNTITQNATEGIPFELITRNQKMLRLKERVTQIAQHSSNVLITGESGTGKELIARAIHRAGPRSHSPFVTVNCAAIPETLLESELFGYEEGAFTGAKKGGRIGKFMLANTGTLFLDEIGDMPLYLQAKLLRVLSDRQVDRIGSSKLVEVDVHLIAATNKNLEEMIEKKEFREDLYYRLSVIPLSIPPLRERKDDIQPLVASFIDKYNRKLGKEIWGITLGALNKLEEYSWPGNVRELENCIEYMVNFELGGELSEQNLPRRLQITTEENPTGSGWEVAPEKRDQEFLGMTLKQILKKSEAEAFRLWNRAYGGHPSLREIKEICNQLGISVASYYRKMEELDL